MKLIKADMENGYFNNKVMNKFNDALQAAQDLVNAGEDLRVRISGKNNKMGEIPSVSLMPYFTCPGRCFGTCAGKCYAAKLANLRPAVLNSYAINTALAALRPDLFWQQVNATLAVSRFFRFHVSGDIMNRDYFARMIDAARNNQHCEILAFTKRYEVVNAWIDENGPLPENLHILFSGWQGLDPINPHNLPITNIFGGKQKIEPAADWKICGGNCQNCACRGLGCWQAKNGETIAFKLH